MALLGDSLQIRAVKAVAWNVPMRSPYRSARRITTTAHNVLVCVWLEDGSIGYGESAPARYVTGETQDSVLTDLHSIVPFLVGGSIEEACALLATRLVAAPGARGALETALLDARARAHGIAVCTLLNAGVVPLQTAFTTDLSLPILSPDEAARRAAEAERTGYRALKIKVGSGNFAEDVARVVAIAEAAPTVRLRLDGNQGFDPPTALALMDALAGYLPRIELLEQPTPAGDPESLRTVQQQSPMPVFADESARTSDEASLLVRMGACSGVVLKMAKSGIAETRKIATAVSTLGGQCLFGCMMETRLGITAALHLTAALGPAVVQRLDLDGHLLVDDTQFVSGGLQQEKDVLAIDPNVPGLGITLLPEAESLML